MRLFAIVDVRTAAAAAESGSTAKGSKKRVYDLLFLFGFRPRRGAPFFLENSFVLVFGAGGAGNFLGVYFSGFSRS